jgi:general secretion pathway protein G
VAALAVTILITAVKLVPLLRERLRYSEARAALTEISRRLDEFYLDNSYYPTTDAGLGALTGADSAPDPGSVHPRPEPKPSYDNPVRDPWGNRFFYQSDGNSYRLGSFGPRRNRGDSTPEMEVRSLAH